MQRLLRLAEVPTPPASVDLYDTDEVYVQLANQIYEHPEVPKWLLKVDDEFRARGTVILHVDGALRKHIAEIQTKIVTNWTAGIPNSLAAAIRVERIEGLLRVDSPAPIPIRNVDDGAEDVLGEDVEVERFSCEV